MAWINLGGGEYDTGDLASLSPYQLKTEFERSTLLFCQRWLKGEREFDLQTSGSTGNPKNIKIQRQQMEASAQQTIDALQLKPTATALVCLDTKYIAGQMMLVRSLMVGMNIHAEEPSGNPLANIHAGPIDFAALVPYQVEGVLDTIPGRLDDIRCAIIGGAAISVALRKKIAGSNCALYATYGMTETISHIALQRLNGSSPQDFFEALPGVILRTEGRGCLCIRTAYLPDEVITNDLVEMAGERKFRWLGRADNVINSGGVKIIPEKIEAILEDIFLKLSIPQRFFIAAVPDESLGQRAMICVEGSAIAVEVQRHILELAANQLPKFEVPKGFRFEPKFSETNTGKILRKISGSPR